MPTAPQSPKRIPKPHDGIQYNASKNPACIVEEIERLYLAIDAPDHLVNWTRRKDKRSVALKAITAVDNKTGYAFCNALNFDETADHAAIKADALLPAPHRKYARIGVDGHPVRA